jgi:hypothetical protein
MHEILTASQEYLEAIILGNELTLFQEILEDNNVLFSNTISLTTGTSTYTSSKKTSEDKTHISGF